MRVYVPSSATGLAELLATGRLPTPVEAHAVTDALRAAHPDGSEEEWEYAASAAAAAAAIGVLAATPAAPARRVVLALDVAGADLLGDPGDPTAVRVVEEVALRGLAAVLADAPEADPGLAAAVAAWSPALEGDHAAGRTVERALDSELGWYAVQELGTLLEGLPDQAPSRGALGPPDGV